jgi:hypothetical protein
MVMAAVLTVAGGAAFRRGQPLGAARNCPLAALPARASRAVAMTSGRRGCQRNPVTCAASRRQFKSIPADGHARPSAVRTFEAASLRPFPVNV